MENEIELKLIASPQFAQFLSQEISNFTILAQKNVFYAIVTTTPWSNFSPKIKWDCGCVSKMTPLL